MHLPVRCGEFFLKSCGLKTGTRAEGAMDKLILGLRTIREFVLFKRKVSALYRTGHLEAHLDFCLPAQSVFIATAGKVTGQHGRFDDLVLDIVRCYFFYTAHR